MAEIQDRSSQALHSSAELDESNDELAREPESEAGNRDNVVSDERDLAGQFPAERHKRTPPEDRHASVDEGHVTKRQRTTNEDFGLVNSPNVDANPTPPPAKSSIETPNAELVELQTDLEKAEADLERAQASGDIERIYARNTAALSENIVMTKKEIDKEKEREGVIPMNPNESIAQYLPRAFGDKFNRNFVPANIMTVDSCGRRFSFVERDESLRILREAFNEFPTKTDAAGCKRDKRRVPFVFGGPGTGKTRLLQHTSGIYHNGHVRNPKETGRYVCVNVSFNGVTPTTSIERGNERTAEFVAASRLLHAVCCRSMTVVDFQSILDPNITVHRALYAIREMFDEWHVDKGVTSETPVTIVLAIDEVPMLADYQPTLAKDVMRILFSEAGAVCDDMSTTSAVVVFAGTSHDILTSWTAVSGATTVHVPVPLLKSFETILDGLVDSGGESYKKLGREWRTNQQFRTLLEDVDGHNKYNDSANNGPHLGEFLFLFVSSRPLASGFDQLPDDSFVVGPDQFNDFFGACSPRAHFLAGTKPNLNFGGPSELRVIDGVGEVLANKIINERKDKAFTTEDEVYARVPEMERKGLKVGEHFTL